MPRELKLLRSHNLERFKGNRAGTLTKDEVSETIKDHFGTFGAQLQELRHGLKEDKFGRILPAKNVSFADAITVFYGIISPTKDKYGKEMNYIEQQKWVISEFLSQLDVYSNTDTLASCAQRFGCGSLNLGTVVNELNKYAQFASPMSAADFQPGSEWHFIIPELILAAIRVDYEASSMHMNWVASTTNISQDEVTMPQIRRGNTLPKKVGEGEDIEYSTLNFGKKKASCFKVGIGFSLTDELIMKSSLDMLFIFLGEVGTDMSISADYYAYQVLRNGEQANGMESAPVIGVEDTSLGFQYRDIKRVTSRMKSLKREPNLAITGEDDGIDISLLPEFKGFNGVTKLSDFKSILGVPDVINNDVYYPAAVGEAMFLDKNKTMTKLQFGSMKIEQDRNPKKQVNDLFVTDWIGFAIIRRDGRIVLNKALDYADNGFPAYMDIAARVTQTFMTADTETV